MLIATDVWVGALLRRAQSAGAFATVARRGDDRAGAVLVKVWNPRTRTATLYSQATGPDGEPLWIRPAGMGDEAQIDAYVQRQLRFDSDLWVVEIEDAQDRPFLTERVDAPPPDTATDS